MISFAAGCTIDTHSTHCCTLFITVALLTHRVRARPGGLLARFSVWCSWPSNELPVDTIREKSSNSFGKKSVSFCCLELWTVFTSLNGLYFLQQEALLLKCATI